jgi:hypothetical protein
MTEISFYHLKADRCARLAKDEPDPRRRVDLETEGALWLQIAVAEDNLEALRRKVQDHLNAHEVGDVRDPSHRPAKGIDLDNPEARRLFLRDGL